MKYIGVVIVILLIAIGIGYYVSQDNSNSSDSYGANNEAKTISPQLNECHADRDEKLRTLGIKFPSIPYELIEENEVLNVAEGVLYIEKWHNNPLFTEDETIKRFSKLHENYDGKINMFLYRTTESDPFFGGEPISLLHFGTCSEGKFTLFGFESYY